MREPDGPACRTVARGLGLETGATGFRMRPPAQLLAAKRPCHAGDVASDTRLRCAASVHMCKCLGR